MEIEFNEDYDLENFTLIQVPQEIVDVISKGDDLIIKGTDSSILCTNNKSFELKYLETSNTMFLLRVLNKNAEEIKNAEILSMKNHIIESNDVIPKKYQPILRIKDNCAISYDLKSAISNINSKIDKNFWSKQIFLKLQICI